MASGYVELHVKSFYSFGEGASHVHELLAQAVEYGYQSLALTDANLCGALEFARLAGSLGIRPITGGELTLDDGSRLVLLARTREGYANISRLFTLANAADRREPRLAPAHLAEHARGVVLLTGGRDGPLSKLLSEGRREDARQLLRDYREWYGADGVYVELQQNFLKGDTARNRELAELARSAGVPLVAANDVHYHSRYRYRLQHALAAAKRNITIEQALPFIRPNHHLCLKPPDRMKEIFRRYPEAVANTVRISEQCDFNLATGLGYSLPESAVPRGYTAGGYLRRLCFEAAQRRYGAVHPIVGERLDEEFRLIERHGLAGFLLLYREIVLLGREIMEERGLLHPETPLEERPPGRGRGSSVALLAGYLIGISHVDPLRWGLTLERFISEDTNLLPDIDLDFPPRPQGRTHPAGAPSFRAGARGPGRGHRRLLGEGHHPGPGQGPGATRRGPEAALPAASLPRRRRPGTGDAGPALLPRQGGVTGMARPGGAGPPADGSAPQPGPARGRDGAEQFPDTGNGPSPGRGHRWPVHHGLEQGQRGRRQLRQDRPALPAGAGPVGGGPGPDGGEGGEQAGPGPHRP